MNAKSDLKKYTTMKAFSLENDNRDPKNIWSLRNPHGFYTNYKLTKEIIKAINACDVSLTGKHILDLGSGKGHKLRWLKEIGGPSGTYVGIELLEERVSISKAMNPSIKCIQADMLAAAKILPQERFEIIFESVSFMELTDDEIKEMFKGVATLQQPSDHMIIHDVLRSSNKSNYLNLKKIKSLAPDYSVIYWKTFFNPLIPWLARFNCAVAEFSDYFLPHIHMLAVLKRNK